MNTTPASRITMRASRFHALHAVLLLASALLLSSCGSAVEVTNAAPSDAVIPYFTPVQQDGKYYLIGLRAKDGSEAWRTTINSSYGLGSLSTSGDILYFSEATSAPSSTPAPGAPSIVALRLSDGKTLWRAPLPPIGYDIGIAVDNGTVLAAGTDALYALDPATGAIRWRQAAQIFSQPHLGNGFAVAMLAGDEPNTASGLIAWRESDGTQLWRLDASPDLNIVMNQATVFGREQGTISARSLETGHILWQFPADGDIHVGQLVAATDSLVLAQTYTPPSEGIQTVALVGLDARTGKQLWTTNRSLYNAQPGSRPLISAGSNGDVTIYGWDGAELVALRTSDGTQIWHTTMSPYSPDQEQSLDGVLYVLLSPPSCDFGLSCWFGPRNMRLAALNPATGAPYWQRDLTEEASLASA